MASIVKIEIEGFKAFPEHFSLDLPEGKNLLMYGENGSGKSSIYYALHALLQSVFKTDHGAKYFTHSDEENLINIYRINDVIAGNFHPNIKLTFNDGDVWTLNLNGVLGSTEDKIKLLNRYAIFINHSYISRFHAARNSEEIDLWNVFYKDILPFYLAPNRTQFLADTFDDIFKKSQRWPMPRIITNGSYLRKIRTFNNDLAGLINQINRKVSDIYNKYFKNIDDIDLDIKLHFLADDDPENTNHDEHYLFYGNNRNGRRFQKQLHNPNIGICIKENNVEINKPQTYFNEAKLTAIALSVRFACLSQHPIDGAFFALDDMLISLDMSNRMKVIDYLLQEVLGKYKIYLFTHDKAFFELAKEIIQFKIQNYNDKWLFKELYNNKSVFENPACLNSDDAYTRAIYHLGKFDYPASANYLRKSVEEMITLFPPYISKNEDGSAKDKLRAKIDAAKVLLTNTDGDVNDINRVILALGTLLNPLSHKSIDTNIYKLELEEIIKILPRLRQHILDLEIKEVIAIENDVYLCVDEDATTKCKIKILLKTPLYSYKGNNGQRNFSVAKGNSIESITIRNGVAEPPQQFSYFTNLTLEECCIRLFAKIGKVYANNYIDFYKNAQGAEFNTLL
jgi:hypothetical protein